MTPIWAERQRCIPPGYLSWKCEVFVMTIAPETLSRLSSAVVAAAAIIAAAGSHVHAQAWTAEWVALTSTSAGVWGAATHRSRTQAISLAIQDCKRRAGARRVACGALISTVRASWSLAYACGGTSFIVIGDTLQGARRKAINLEVSAMVDEPVDATGCQLITAIGPDGRQIKSRKVSRIVPLIPATERDR